MFSVYRYIWALGIRAACLSTAADDAVMPFVLGVSKWFEFKEGLIVKLQRPRCAPVPPDRRLLSGLNSQLPLKLPRERA